MKKIFSMILVIAMALSTFALPAFAAGSANVAKIGTTEYATLAKAFADAGKLGGATIEILKDFNFDSTKAITVSGNVTLSGAHTISRGTYAGTMFTVSKNATLTLDGGLVIDGSNSWIFDSVGYYADMKAGMTLNTGAKNSYTTSAGTASTAAMITVANGGTAVMNNATICNSWGKSLFTVPTGATLITNEGSLIKHIHGSAGCVAGQLSGTWTMNGGKIEDVYGHNTNGGLVDIRGGVFNIDGGEITNVRTFGLKSNSNGILAQVYGENSKLNITDGNIHDNASFAPGNGWGAVVYLNRGGDFTMTGGRIVDTKTDICSAFVSNTATSIELLGGTIEVDVDTVASRFESLIYGDVIIGEEMNLIGSDDARFLFLIEEPDVAEINGNVSGTGIMWLMNYTPVVGNGTITSDVLVKTHSYYPNPKIALAGANWNCLITVDSVGSEAALTVQPGATVSDGLVRVLESVESGDYLDAASAAAQASSYIEENGATVESPVLYYHRLTDAQKKNIVVTFDYNGGLDAQGWSGCQITSDTAYETLELPVPTMEGYVISHWEYAIVNDPESLIMAGLNPYNGEAVSETVRLIAVWEEEFTPFSETIKGKVTFDGSLRDGQFTFVLKQNDEVIARTTNDENGNFSFDVNFEEEGTYTYVVDQIDGNADIIYDQNTFEVTFNVAKDGTVDFESENILFVNEIRPSAFATVSGNVYLDGELADVYYFTLVDEYGNIIDVAESVNGEFTFAEMEFDSEATYTYFVTQNIPADTTGILYDDSAIEVCINVTKTDATYLAAVSYKRVETLSFYNTSYHVHTEEVVEGKAPTCTETGLTEGTKCSECGETLVAQEEIPAKGHVAGDEVIENVVEATEEKGGSYEIAVYCTVCGTELSREYYITDPLTPKDPAPETTEPEVTEPEVTEPEVTEPEVTEPEVTEPEEEITEPEIPLDPAPDTGDNALIAILAAVAALALGVVYFKRRETTEE